MDKAFFGRQMKGMAVVLKNEDTTADTWPLKLEIYWRRFKDWPNERFQTAVDRVMEKATFFPTPAELIAAGTIAQDTAEEAWARVQRAVRDLYQADVGWFAKPDLTPLDMQALAAAGGQRAFSLADPTTASVMHSHFLKHYRILQGREEEKQFPALGTADTVQALSQRLALEKKETP